MSRRYSIAEARTNLPLIVDEAEAGGEIELTRWGEPVAVVLSIRELEKLRAGRRSFREGYDEFLKRYSAGEAGVSEAFIKTLRDRTKGRKVRL